MPFLAYVAILLVSVSALLFQINWLTKPKLETKLETKPAIQAASTASTAVPPREVTKIERPESGPTPVVVASPTIASAASASEPAARPAAPNTETIGAATPAVAAVVTPSILAAPAMATTPAPAAPMAPAAAQPAAQPQPQLRPTLATSAPNSCDVQGCASAYQSFRASDCSYQPFDGPRRICEKPPEAGQKLAAEPPRESKAEAIVRKPNKDAELRDVERAVKRITAGEDAGLDRSMGESRVIVIERPARDW